MCQISGKLDELMDSRSQTTGRRRMLVTIGSVVVFLAGLATWAITETSEVGKYSAEVRDRLDRLIQMVERQQARPESPDFNYEDEQ